MSEHSAEKDAPDERCNPEDHDWVFDGYFWYVCDICGAVS